MLSSPTIEHVPSQVEPDFTPIFAHLAQSTGMFEARKDRAFPLGKMIIGFVALVKAHRDSNSPGQECKVPLRLMPKFLAQ